MKGNQQAFKMLYERYAGRMLAICLRYVGDSDTAHDLMQDGFLKAYTSMHRFRPQGEGSLAAWLGTIMRNEALMYLRQNDVLKGSISMDNAPEAAEVPDEDEVDRIPSEVLMQLLSELPVGYRTVLNLYVMEGKSHKEIAELLGIKERSSASQLVRAKAVLAEKVNEWLKNNK